MLQYHFNWHQLSVIAGISSRRFYFRLFPGAIKGPQVIEFLHALGNRSDRSCWSSGTVRRFIAVRWYASIWKHSRVRCRSSRFRPMRQNSIPAEYIWGHLKHHELPNRCAQNMTDLKTNTRNRLRSMQRRSTLVRAFWQQAELAL